MQRGVPGDVWHATQTTTTSCQPTAGYVTSVAVRSSMRRPGPPRSSLRMELGCSCLMLQSVMIAPHIPQNAEGEEPKRTTHLQMKASKVVNGRSLNKGRMTPALSQSHLIMFHEVNLLLTIDVLPFPQRPPQTEPSVKVSQTREDELLSALKKLISKKDADDSADWNSLKGPKQGTKWRGGTAPAPPSWQYDKDDLRAYDKFRKKVDLWMLRVAPFQSKKESALRQYLHQFEMMRRYPGESMWQYANRFQKKPARFGLSGREHHGHL